MVPNVRIDCRCLTLFTMALAGVGCRVDAPTASGPPVVLERVSGDGQRARPGEPLERPLVARLLDAEGRPVRRVEVRWTVTAGEVKPRLSATDASGEARATWTPGTVAGAQRAVASADGLPPIEFTAVVDPDAVPDRIPLRALAVDTYDGSNQVVHPDVALSSLSGADDVPRLIITPYPWGNASFENPSLYEGNGREVWFTPATVTNPIVKPTRGYLSDPDLVSVPDGAGALWLYSRRVDGENEILLTQSADGVRWSAPRVVVRVPSHEAVSPTIVRRSATDWLMWTVNSGPAGCGSASTTVEMRRSTDGITWSPPTTTMLSQGGVFAWHLEVQWIPTRGEYWALVQRQGRRVVHHGCALRRDERRRHHLANLSIAGAQARRHSGVRGCRLPIHVRVRRGSRPRVALVLRRTVDVARLRMARGIRAAHAHGPLRRRGEVGRRAHRSINRSAADERNGTVTPAGRIIALLTWLDMINQRVTRG